jgi:hypothetical protein
MNDALSLVSYTPWSGLEVNIEKRQGFCFGPISRNTVFRHEKLLVKQQDDPFILFGAPSDSLKERHRALE